MCKNSYCSLCVHILGCPGRDAKYDVLQSKVDWYQLLLLIQPREITGHAHSDQDEKKYKGNVF